MNTLATNFDFCEGHKNLFFFFSGFLKKQKLNQKLLPQDDITDEI